MVVVDFLASGHPLQALRLFQQLPLGPDESPRIRTLQQMAEELEAKALAMQSKNVPRPSPSQYQAVVAEVQRFVGGMGSLERILGIVQGLQVGALLS